MELDTIDRLTKDLKESSVTLTHSQARFLVDAYYMMQEQRKRSDNQERSLVKDGEPHELINWLATQSRTLENQVARTLDVYSNAHEISVWARSIVGIGPIISAGLLAHIDIEKAPTVGHIWRFAGLDPTVEWGKGEKRPWNASLKTLCWKIGESFVKVCGNEEARYGAIYAERKLREIAKNDAGDFSDQAEKMLKKKNFKKDTDAKKHYLAGRLPPAHIHARAKRYATKLFLAHYHDTAYRIRYGVAPPLPYAIAILGHAHHLKP